MLHSIERGRRYEGVREGENPEGYPGVIHRSRPEQLCLGGLNLKASIASCNLAAGFANLFWCVDFEAHFALVVSNSYTDPIDFWD